ncbi:MAG: hypothetical protein WB402_14655 [Sulfuricaulis sp.]|uniref:hypothetical protein n=1 Tax=Sulfuricaulis sp. TaxID=2003553 RepID=UPI003C5E01B8
MLPIVMGLAGFVGLAGCNGETKSNKVLETSLTMNQKKIDPALLMTIQQSVQPEQPMDVLIRTQGAIDATQRAALEGRGARIGSVMGDVVTARVPARAVARIADLEFVVHIEISKQQRLR